jgi:hypothetical protein
MLLDQGIVAKPAPTPGGYHSEPASAGDSDPEGLRISVILTTIAGTLAALRAAAPVGAPSRGIELFRETRHHTRR